MLLMTTSKIKVALIALACQTVISCGGGGGGGNSDPVAGANTNLANTPTTTIPPTTITPPSAPVTSGHFTFILPPNEGLFGFNTRRFGDISYKNSSHLISNNGETVTFSTISRSIIAGSPKYINIYQGNLKSGTVTKIFDWANYFGADNPVTFSDTYAAGSALDGYVSKDGISVTFPASPIINKTYGGTYLINISVPTLSIKKTTIPLYNYFAVSPDGSRTAVLGTNDLSKPYSLQTYSDFLFPYNGATNFQANDGNPGKFYITSDNKTVMIPSLGFGVNIQTGNKIPIPKVVRLDSEFNANGIAYGNGDMLAIANLNNPTQVSVVAVTDLFKNNSAVISDLLSTSFAVVKGVGADYGNKDSATIVDLTTLKQVVSINNYDGTYISENGAYSGLIKFDSNTNTINFDAFATGLSNSSVTKTILTAN